MPSTIAGSEKCSDVVNRVGFFFTVALEVTMNLRGFDIITVLVKESIKKSL